MAYTDPTVDEFIERFPEFAGQEDAAAFALIEAKLNVDTSWREADYGIAIMLLMAHLMSAGESASSGREIASESIGPLSVSYFKSDSTWLASTGYGSRWLRILRANRSGPLVV